MVAEFLQPRPEGLGQVPEVAWQREGQGVAGPRQVLVVVVVVVWRRAAWRRAAWRRP